MPAPLEKVNILGTDVDNVTMSETLDRVSEMVNSDKFSYIVTPNVDHLMKLRKNREFSEIYQGASLAVPDGVPLLWASKIIGTPLKERVNGTDLFFNVCELAAAKSHSVFLLGGNVGVAKKAAELLQHKYSGLIVSGYHCPQFGFENDLNECARIQEMIAKAKTKILFVALGAPKQEKWMAEFGAGCGVRVAIGIGISFSFVTGEIKRAPAWMQKRGFEWLWRMLSEPRRLCKRYIIDDTPFLFWMLKTWLTKRF